jgi:hypothetical protein
MSINALDVTIKAGAKELSLHRTELAAGQTFACKLMGNSNKNSSQMSHDQDRRRTLRVPFVALFRDRRR